MPRVLLGMNGGVDSSCAAWLLQRDAYEVVGVTLRFHDLAVEEEGQAEAARVCELLGIEHIVVDARDRFRTLVEEPVLEACRNGDVPEPDALCATHLMFPLLMELADEHGCEHIATGHFARITPDDGMGSGLLPLQLRTPKDRFKDQSYLLYGLGQDVLERVIFPFADMLDVTLRQTAMRSGVVRLAPLSNGRGWSFPQEGDYFDWLEEQGLLERTPGDVIALGTTNVIGSHRGLCHYDIGQELDLGDDSELVVVAKDPISNCIFAGPANLAAVESVQMRNMEWVSCEPFAGVRSCKVRFRYADKAVPCQAVSQPDGSMMINFTRPRAGLTPGHPAIFYSDDIVLGGGLIA